MLLETFTSMEGPSLVILKEELSSFTGKRISEVGGNSKEPIERLLNQKIVKIDSWGKHFLISLDGFFIKVHFLMFGSYSINTDKSERIPRLSIYTSTGFFNFYSCSIKLFDGKPEDFYNWKTDLMSDFWDQKHLRRQISKYKDEQVCDVLMNQDIFSGLGNIIKNEVLFNLRIHPESKLNALSPKKINELILESRDYSFRFYEWKKKFELKKHWNIYKKRKCKLCGMPVIIKKTGKGERTSYYCPVDQILYE